MKKIVAPVVITVILILILIAYVAFFSQIPDIGIGIFLKWGALVVLVSLMGVSLFVLHERIKEIRSGEEDDLSKY